MAGVVLKLLDKRVQVVEVKTQSNLPSKGLACMLLQV